MDKVIRVSIELHSLLLTGDWRMGNVYETRPYLSGAALRGAVADAMMRDWAWEKKQIPHPDECDEPDCEFCQVFYPKDAPPPRFGDCYPVLQDDHPLPLPATARTCKYHPGFIIREDPEENHGVFDILIRQAAFEDALANGQTPLYLYEPDCPVCCGKVKPQEGHYAVNGSDRFYSARTHNRRFSRTAINRARGAVEPELLFTLEGMGEQMQLEGWNDDKKGEPLRSVTNLQGEVFVGEAQAEAVRTVLAQVEWLGGVRSRGLGQVKVTARFADEQSDPIGDVISFLDPIQNEQFPLPLRLAQQEQRGDPLQPKNLIERLLAFNQKLQAERQFWQAMSVDVLPGVWYFTLDLLSDTFLADEAGLPTLQLTPQMAGLTGAGLPLVEKTRSWVTRAYRSGWSGVKNLPRPVKLGVEAGSVYLYRADAASEDAHRKLIETLARLENTGVGEERERGAGRVMVCAPFHLEVEPR